MALKTRISANRVLLLCVISSDNKSWLHLLNQLIQVTVQQILKILKQWLTLNGRSFQNVPTTNYVSKLPIVYIWCFEFLWKFAFSWGDKHRLPFICNFLVLTALHMGLFVESRLILALKTHILSIRDICHGQRKNASVKEMTNIRYTWLWHPVGKLENSLHGWAKVWYISSSSMIYI